MKQELVTTLWQEESDRAPAHRDIHLILTQEVRDLLGSRHILEEDVQKVIHQANCGGKYLVNPDNGRRLARYKPVRVTYWVEFEPIGQAYSIHNAYSHRMHLPEEKS